MKVSPRAVTFARQMRHAATRSESRLWKALRSRRFSALKFRRQQPVGPFILDFYCPALRLAIEVDGRHHDDRWIGEHDGARTLELQRLGVEVLRIPNELIMRDSQTVEEIIAAAIERISKK